MSSPSHSPSTITVETSALFITCGHYGLMIIYTCRCHFVCFVEKASITVTPEWNRRHAGETLNLSAVVTGNPLPTIITVEKLDQLTGLYVDYPITKYSVMGLSTISFTALSLEDNGQYRACVENSHDSIECSPFTIMMTGW